MPKLLVLGAVAAAFLGCSVLASSCWPSSTEQRAVSAPPTVATARAKEASLERPVEPARFELEDFTPLLALPELDAAATAVEEQQFARAAGVVREAIEALSLLPDERVRYEFLLGRLCEQSGDGASALAAYDRAAALPWPLEGYAYLGAARALVRAGLHEAALERLRKVKEGGPAFASARLLAADALFSKGERAEAIAIWREHLGSDGPSARGDTAPTALRLADALLTPPSMPPDAAQPMLAAMGAPQRPDDAELVEVVALARRAARLSAASISTLDRCALLERRALAQLPETRRRELSVLTADEQLAWAQALESARSFVEAEVAARKLLESLPEASRWQRFGCEAAIVRGKALAGKREWGPAVDALDEATQRCADPEQGPRLLFLAAKFSASDGRHAQAVRYSEKLERLYPKDRLADDARLRAAQSYLELGAEARFTELLAAMPDDYPDGDMMLDGVFQLALRRLSKRDFGGAASVLERAATIVSRRDSPRGQEFSGRERYFLARALLELGERERALSELEGIIAELPLSYYMLHAYSRLVSIDAPRAQRAREDALFRTEKEPFVFERRTEHDDPGFVRALELLRVGDNEAAQSEFDALGMVGPTTSPAVLWGVSLLYDRAGLARLSHNIAKNLLKDWLERWPTGDWVRPWQLAYPRPHEPLVRRAVEQHGVDASLAYAVMREESAFDPNAVSTASAYGLMQLIVPTAKTVARPLGLPHSPQALKKPSVNIQLGCRLLGQLGRDFAPNPLLAIPAYNAGPGRPRRWVRELPTLDFDVWVELIPFRETRRYTKRVLASRATYAWLYEPERAEQAMRLPLTIEVPPAPSEAR
jgi:soluble lytic murein transglycosylase